MKKIILSIFSAVFLFSCSDTGVEVVSYADYSSDISYKVGSPRDTRLTFFDVNEFKQIRTVPNNLSSGDLAGRVQFAQTHTIDPNNNEERKEPSLIPYRAALLLFTPQMNLSSLEVKATYKVDELVKSEVYVMMPPINMPKSDYNNNGTKKDITYSKRSWSVQLPYYAVEPNMQLEFMAKTKDGLELTGTLSGEDIEFAAPIEGAFLFIRLGMLTDNLEGIKGRYHDMITDTAHAMQEYFQTVPFAQLSAGIYEDRILKKVILDNGTIYENKSSFAGADYYSGDMRESVAKAQVSVGIDLANKGVIDSALNQIHEITHDMFYFTVHHAIGRYTDDNGGAKDVIHGLSGGNGIGTLVDSRGNEFSHEVGHGYNMGHYPNSNESADGSIHGYSTSWGYDAYKNRMRANVAWNSNPDSYIFYNHYITPFQDTYGWNKDSMAGGWADSAISRYSHNTARSTRQIQKNIEGRYFLSDSKNNNGKYYYLGWDKSAREYKQATEANFINKRINPTEKGVPVITILGGYDPQSPYNAVLYPYFRANWGNVFASIFKASLPADAVNYLKITYYGTKPAQYVVLNNSRYSGGIINKLHFNIAESDKPKTISLYVNNTLKGTTTIDEQVYNTLLKKPVIIGKGKGYDDVINEDAAYLETKLAGKTIDNYTLTAKEKELIEILYRFSALNKLSSSQKAVAEDYINNKNKTDEVNMYIDDNYTLLENNDISADKGLKNLLESSGLGTVVFKFNQAEINGRCMEVYESAESRMSVKAAICNDSKNQRWAIDKSGRIHSAIYPGYCLEQGKMAVLQLCSENTKQQWKIRNSDISSGVVYENIGVPGQCIDNSGSEPEKIIAYSCSEAANQKFKNKISEDNNTYFSLFNGSLIEEIWKYIPAESGESK